MPVTAVTFLLMRKVNAADKNKEVLKFLDWALHDGQTDSLKLDYVPFPDSVVKQIEASWTNELKAWP